MPKQILIIDDDADDSMLLEQSLRQKKVVNPIGFLRGAEGLMDYLLGTGPYTDRKLHPLPELIFLDLRLPRKSGLEVLQWLGTHTEVRKPKVVLYTQSTDFEDVEKSRQLGADAVLIKQTLDEQLPWVLVQFPEVWEFGDGKKGGG
jgi:CheY-like chemotaxis protein